MKIASSCLAKKREREREREREKTVGNSSATGQPGGTWMGEGEGEKKPKKISLIKISSRRYYTTFHVITYIYKSWNRNCWFPATLLLSRSFNFNSLIRLFACYVIAAKLEDDNKRFLIIFYC